jgi:carbamate kinase
MALDNEFRKIGKQPAVATVVTQVEVSDADPSFQRPTKPIGSFFSKEDADYHALHDGWTVMEDAGRGYRRVVPSPNPMAIVEIETIRTLVRDKVVVIAAGGGGIPVVRDAQGMLSGREAVIDKDLAASLLARQLDADLFIISTAVAKVCLDYGKPTQRTLDSMTLAEAERYTAEGQFAPGSMLPKIQAMTGFVSMTGKEGVITDPDHLEEAVSGTQGTHIVL